RFVMEHRDVRNEELMDEFRKLGDVLAALERARDSLSKGSVEQRLEALSLLCRCTHEVEQAADKYLRPKSKYREATHVRRRGWRIIDRSENRKQSGRESFICRGRNGPSSGAR
ncbi:MAG: hypothetical protein AAF085_01495, partial [Planctomycetota bacterium]